MTPRPSRAAPVPAGPASAAHGLAGLTLAALLFVSLGCSPGSGAGTQGNGPRATTATPSGSQGALRAGVPFAQVSAEARQTGRPILMYFWTSW
ncbi:MAG: hypothetical protein P1V36_05810 [Planctomycetota bacterium]|nr:hypothetical protein [Planctomycetota bacterium]